MRALASAGVVVVSACLIAPSKPSDRGRDGGAPAGDAPAITCLGPEDTAGPAAAIQLDTSGAEGLVRGGRHAGQPAVFFYLPPVSNTRCPSLIAPLPFTSAGNGTPQVVAISVAADLPLTSGIAVLAAVSDGVDTAVYVLAYAGGGAPGATLVGSGLAPVPIATFDQAFDASGTDSPAFVLYDSDNNTVYAGGGAHVGTALLAGSGGVLAAPAFTGADAPQDDVWYGVAKIESVSQIALVGAQRTYLAYAPDAGDVNTGTDYPHGKCPASSACEPRVARAAAHADTRVAIASAGRYDGDLEIVEHDNVVDARALAGSSVPGFPSGIGDLEIEDFTGSGAPDIAALWVNGEGALPSLYVYADVIGGSDVLAAAAAMPVDPADANVSRVVAVRRSATDHTLLLLTDQPGRDGEACVHFSGSVIGACP